MECKLQIIFVNMFVRIFNFIFFYFSCQSVQNLGLAVVSSVSGIIVGKGDVEGYSMLELFFIIWLFGKFLKQFYTTFI